MRGCYFDWGSYAQIVTLTDRYQILLMKYW